MLSAANRQILHDFAAQGALVITANRRLQRALLSNATTQAWQAAPSIYAADDWVAEQWLELQDQAFPGSDRVLLTPYQSRKLWQEVVESDPPTHALISPAQLARQAEAAAQLVDEWDLAVGDAEFDQREEYRCFRRWHQRLEKLLEERSLGSAAYCRAQVQRGFETAALPRVAKIVLYGFDDLSPRLGAIFAAAAFQVEHWHPQLVESSRCLHTAAADTEAEIRAAALWSRQRLEAHQSDESGSRISIRIGIIVPQLNSWRGLVERIFSEVYETASWLPSAPRLTPPFNFSAGVPLASTPLVADALLLLSLNLRYLLPDDWRRLLLSPFWGGGLDNCRRKLLLQLNRSSKMRLSVGELRRMAAKAQSEEDWPLGDVLASLAEMARRHKRQQSYNAWADFFAEQLRLCNWPGDRIIDSPEYQQQEQFFRLLEQLGQCDACLPAPVSLDTALQSLRELAEQATFQAQTEASPVQILGLLEGAGLQFDHCWVMDLSDLNWPPAAKPNPFIPLPLQIRLALPRSNAGRELDYARALTSRLASSASEIIFSWPASDGDHNLQPSRLIQHFEPVAIETLTASRTPLQIYTETVAASADFEWLDCAKAPPWPDLTQTLPGGTGSIKLQALCPFNAFAVYRLGAWPQEQATAGLTAAERGTIVHELMANLWTEIGDHKTLCEMDVDRRLQLVHEKVEATLSPWRLRRDDVLHPQFYRLEQERLEALAAAWLNYESERPPFTVVATECRQDLTIQTNSGTAHLSGRIDRIDRLPSGKSLIIDYKTGGASLGQWQGERPADLQLPLYALAQTPGEADEATAIAFAEINARRTAFTGVGSLSPEDGAIDGIDTPSAPNSSQLPEDWPSTLEYWRTAAATLLQEFIDGYCSTTVYNKAQAQYYRHLEPLNRVKERG